MEKDLKIFKSKTLADGSKYFGLFEKHIPALNAGSSVYLYMLGNLHCICEIIQKNPNSKYFIYDSDEVIKAVQIMMDNIDISKTVDLYDIDMKFDCIVMNPPYQKNLHLKILAEAIKHLKDDDSKVVNLSPVRWLQDPLAKYKKNSDYNRFENSISKHIESLTYYGCNEISQIFNAGLPNSCIYVCNYKCVFNEYIKFATNTIVDKVYEKGGCVTNLEFDKDKFDGWRVKISPIYGGGCAGSHSNGVSDMRNIGKMLVFNNGIREGKPWHKFYAHNGATKIQAEIPYSIKFNTEAEAENFCKSFSTHFVKCYVHWVKTDVHVGFQTFPWMGDSINPRTGLKGYMGEWTDADLYKYFNITPEEQKVIEDTMAKYNKTN